MNHQNENPKRPAGPAWISRKNLKLERLLSQSYRKDELLVFYKRKPTEKDVNTIRESFRKAGFKADNIQIGSCGNCDIPVQRWRAKGIHTLLSGNSIRAGSGPAATTVGESYSLNFLNQVPAPSVNELDEGLKRRIEAGRKHNPQHKKHEIVIAVLDTGFDPKLADPQYLWGEAAGTKGEKCYQDVHAGWNFVQDNGNFEDDNPARHGTIVSQYIINQFKHSKTNGVKIMALKTHDRNGVGDLFSIICGINFAIAKGAKIINASWGFYYYFDTPMPYLKTLITGVLRKKGILFVTAAGNQIAADDLIARQIYQAEYGVTLTDDQLRNLAIHNFYPAQLSTATNSVIVATTTDGRTVSATQNYSNKFVELGVMADQFTRLGMDFEVPFEGVVGAFISGSSFATAIASGTIGANCDPALYVPGIQKQAFLQSLKTIGLADGSGNILTDLPPLSKKYVKNGSCLK
ncbi:S8 family serine peptidase [Pedobacter africanus]|uniref:Subtilase family protein n=1 Tax=Pedobacter africanus TaxID=151894 RepID=A0A1W1YVN8_9SPHI|nr:S8 family serine peptidase [Pedobacter africanus]SMC39891.1 Subtilase family protein [Pedobacter africanus]